MIQAVIIDDEENNISNLLSLLGKYCPGVEVVGTAGSAAEGEAVIRRLSPDLVFLDIQMPGKTGFDLLKALPSYGFEIIFVTAFDQYGVQAVKFAAIDYLLKPVDVDELKAAVQKAEERMKNKKQNLRLENLIRLLETKNKDDHKIALPSTKETRFVKPQEIIRCESLNNYTNFHLVTKERLTISKPIYEFETILSDYGFIRCHQSHLVNKRFIKSWIKKEGDFLLLDDDSEIPVSRQRKDYLKEQLR